MTAEAAADAAAFVFDPYDYATQEDPYPAYAWLRANAPLYQNVEQDFWALSRHADIVAAFRSEGTFSNKMGVTLDESAWGENASAAMSFLAMDPPDQTRLRKLVSQGFTPRRVKELEPRIREITLSYLEPMLDGGSAASCDFIADFAGRLPMDVISEMLGVATSERQELRRLADLLVHREDGQRDVPAEGVEAYFSLVAYYTDLLADRRKNPRDDLTSALVVAEIDGDRLSEHEIIAFLMLMIVAGNETTTKLLGNALFWAHRFPAQLDSVLTAEARGPRVSQWVEETLRYDGSTQLLARYLLQDVELHGLVAPAGSRLVLLVGSANRDEAVFPHADQFDLDRDTSAMASFGGGRHYCLGANLARLEANVALDELVKRVRGIDVHAERAARVHSVNVRGFASLPVTFTAR